MKDKLDTIIEKLDIMQCDINDMKNKVQTTITNQVKISNALNQNFQVIVNKQVELAVVLNHSLIDI